jgi:PAS domain S-box-containing protein
MSPTLANLSPVVAGLVVVGGGLALTSSIAFYRRRLRQQRRLLERLSESEQRFRTLFERSPDAVLLFDSERAKFVDCNDAALSVLRCTREWLVDKHPWDIAPPLQPDGRRSIDVATELVNHMRSVKSLRFEWQHGRGDGTNFPAEISSTAVDVGGVLTFLAVVRDITERKRAEAALRELNAALEQRVSTRTAELASANEHLRIAERDLKRALEQEKELHQLKSNFVSMVSHEFRTPMGMILSSSQLLERHLDRLGTEERAELFGDISLAVRRMNELMEEVLVLSRVESSEMALKPAPLDVRSFCQQLIDELLSATHQRCAIHLELPTDGVISADESLLRHILGNLISNAVKYSNGGDVRVAVDLQPEEVTFRVIDTGVGIPLADQPKLFHAFHRGRNVDHLPGTGLGLTIAKRCVDLHLGQISFESHEGTGTTFEVRIPLAPNGGASLPYEEDSGD